MSPHLAHPKTPSRWQSGKVARSGFINGSTLAGSCRPARFASQSEACGARGPLRPVWVLPLAWHPRVTRPCGIYETGSHQWLSGSVARWPSNTQSLRHFVTELATEPLGHFRSFGMGSTQMPRWASSDRHCSGMRTEQQAARQELMVPLDLLFHLDAGARPVTLEELDHR